MKTLFVGQSCIHLKRVDSTNSYASELLDKTKPAEGTFMYTFEQEKGRGQRGNTWDSEPNKNVACSIILYPSFLQANKQFLLTKITSLAVADLMAELLKSSPKTPDIKIKWPNDIYVDNKKIAGILIENSLRESNIQSAIIGIGINCNQLTFNSKMNATSLALVANKEFDLMQVIELLCEFIEARYLQLKANKQENIDADYLQRLYQIGEWHYYSSNNQLFEGKIVGSSPFGKLQILIKSGDVKEFDLKEIKFVQ
jgi:BirA family biotin operon repressor/biotin-[acetyl-CoA-carboxylase] ligase